MTRFGYSPALAIVLALVTAAPAGAAATTPLACHTLPGVEPLIAPGAIALVGELHGTAESPVFFAELVCAALAKGLAVTVALEIPREEGARIDAFLDSGGTPDDRRALLAGNFWQRAYQDGRSSRAYLDLLDRLRRDVTAKRMLRVILLDQEARMSSGAARDAYMESQLEAAVKARPDDFVAALTGDLHSRILVGTPWDEHYEPMGYLLAKALPQRKLTALTVATTGGTAWYCTGSEPSSCQARNQRGRPEGDAGRVVIGETVNEQGYHGYYAIGPMTASPPAVEPAPGSPGG